jgi:hypothetical protein
MKTIQVKNCSSCPFCQTDWQDSSSYCAFPDDKENEVYNLVFEKGQPAPENCPLRENKVKIKLKKLKN